MQISRLQNVHIWKNIKIKLDSETFTAFHNVKQIIAFDDVFLQYPDYNKTFDLTTDASLDALGTVLSQNNRPITTLSKTERNYTKNEREILAIV